VSRSPWWFRPGELKSWQAFAFAVAVTASTVAVRMLLDGPLGGTSRFVPVILVEIDRFTAGVDVSAGSL